MDLRFLRGDPQAPKGHAIFFARSSEDERRIFYTYCVVPPLPLSLARYLPSILAAHLPMDEPNVQVMPIPPMLEELEEGKGLDYLQVLARYRDDDLCELGAIHPRDEAAKMQLAAQACQEYGQLYLNYSTSFEPVASRSSAQDELPALDDLDPEELLFQTMTDRQRLAELGKLVGVARYALEGNDSHLLQETRQKMQRIVRLLPEKYKGNALITAACDTGKHSARIAELYLERAYKLLDEEYADIPRIEQAIRELQQSA
ncbi:hypothetical protein [Thermogemmatispora onikobensis]|uniref:hypothetical protein n=1 Tax=Thermogemmatispora onikobensis TaxID=732234 RepID=UPI0008539AF6|nr:hypothetical protein [Thermogemmatispora onikobensis]